MRGCQPSCSSGWGDCDGNKNNGCETQLNTLTDCGACGASCTKAHGTPTCASGSCQIASCNGGLRVYHAYLPERGVIVSLFSVGKQLFGEQLMGKLRP